MQNRMDALWHATPLEDLDVELLGLAAVIHFTFQADVGGAESTRQALVEVVGEVAALSCDFSAGLESFIDGPLATWPHHRGRFTCTASRLERAARKLYAVCADDALTPQGQLAIGWVGGRVTMNAHDLLGAIHQLDEACGTPPAHLATAAAEGSPSLQ